ncbi:MAG: hypothetical protein K2X90_00250 [Candidatus Babeliaceae bacterium]|nr:hypothetical protein [Candidatus Babeliaceae bacterium]
MLKKIIIVSCSVVVASVFAMEKSQLLKYTVGMRIPNATYEGKQVNPVHMTITYLGEADEGKLEKAEAILATINTLRPIRVNVGKSDIFGTQERPIPVMHLIIEDARIEELLIQMHQQLGVNEPSQTEKFEIPRWHVSVKDTRLQEELLALQGSTLAGGKLFIKPLGNFDPIVEVE